MPGVNQSGEPMRVVVAGGGIAALEVLAGLRALAGERVAATLLSLSDSFSYRPLSTAVPFTFRDERTRRLDELAGGLGAAFVHDGLAHVDTARGRVLTHDGDLVSHDRLVVAVGARPAPAAAGQRWARGAEGKRLLTRLLRELEEEATRSVAFIVPPDAAWPIDGYELSLVASLAARRARSKPKVFLLTAEEAPLEALGRAAGEAVRDELARAGVELIEGVRARDSTANEDVGRDAFSAVVARLSRPPAQSRARDQIELELEPGRTVTVDRAVSLPAVHGPAIAGVPHDRRGFIPIDGHCRVHDAGGVYAAGDATPSSLKHSTLAAAQATSVAEAIAAEAGAGVEPSPWSPVLYGILTLPPHFAGAPGSPWLDDGEPLAHCLWWPPGHVSGRYLGPYLASRDAGVRPGLDWHPNGLPIAVPVATDGEGEAGPRPSAPTESAVRHDAITRQLLAIHRAEREGTRLEQALERRREEFERHEREVIQQLRAAGYLRDQAARSRLRSAGR
jgi:sulfide:quinone oxidoreductase